jgi:hypothetical protein
MAYTITHPEGMKDTDFPTYARILTQKGVDLGRVPRVLEPTTGRRWLYVWPTRDEAEKVLQQLQTRTEDRSWVLDEVGAPTSQGPLGPVFIHRGQEAEGYFFGLDSLSRAMLRSAFPEVVGPSAVSWDTDSLSDFQRNRQGTLLDLSWDAALNLTRLTREQLQEIGFVVVDDDTGKTVASISPAVAVSA